jgi:DNA-directed RNA polymerase sigma subunit (sigma70/sigma32)
LLAKNRIDETNIDRIDDLADSLLNEEEAAKVKQAVSFLKRALNEICEEYGQWAIEIGEMYGRVYGVSHIDYTSLALDGLYKATIRFQPSGSFKAYAASWIRQCIQRSVDKSLIYTLNSPIKQGENSTHIEQISSDDVVWGSSVYYGRDPFALEELRIKYCDHLTLDQVQNLVSDEVLAEQYGC